MSNHANSNTKAFEHWDYNADVVVIGLGGAGASAAIEAHDCGASVLVLEKQAESAHFPNTRMSGGGLHNPHPDGNRAARAAFLKAMMSGENIPWKLEGEMADRSGEMSEMFADHIMDVVPFLMAQAPELDPHGFLSHGDASFSMFPGFAAAKYGRTVHCRYINCKSARNTIPPYQLPKLQKYGGEAFFWALVEEGIKLRRPKIALLYESPAIELIQRNDQAVIGVLAVQGGRTLRIRANRAVILTCGGFEFSLPMRKAFLEGPGASGWSFYGSPYNTGDGIEMALRVGAGLVKVSKAAARIEAAFPYGTHYLSEGLKLGASTTVTSKPNSLIIDNHGKRFCNEQLITDSTRPYRYQFYKEAVQFDMMKMLYPRIPSWVIFDETRRSAGPVVRMTGSTVGYGFLPWTADNMDAIRRGWILKADTIEELAVQIRADPENRNLLNTAAVMETVDKFNNACSAGRDSEFGRSPVTMGPVKTPPFYAMKLYPGGPNTKGGIDADAQRRVLNWSGIPIPRLFTAGEISSVFKFAYQAGGNLTDCIVCGRVAGRNAAKLKPW